MAKRHWSIDLDGRTHQVTVDHRPWSGTLTVRIDGEVAFRRRPGLFRFADTWLEAGKHPIRFGEHDLTVLTALDFADLIVDGRSASTGEAVPSLPQSPSDPLYRIARHGLSVALLAVLYIFLTTFLFGRFAPDWGPRWFAANALVLSSGVLPLGAGFGLLMLNYARFSRGWMNRAFGASVGVICLWATLTTAIDVPAQLADVIAEPEHRTIDVLDSSARPGKTPTIRTVNGMTYEWAWSFGLWTYPTLSSGTYEIVLSANRHLVVAARKIE